MPVFYSSLMRTGVCQSFFRYQGQIVGWWHADEFAKCNLTFDPDLLMNYPFDFLPYDVLGLSMRWPFDDVLDCRCVSIHLSSRSCPSIKWWSMSCLRTTSLDLILISI